MATLLLASALRLIAKSEPVPLMALALVCKVSGLFKDKPPIGVCPFFYELIACKKIIYIFFCHTE